MEKLGCNNDAWTDREFSYSFIQSPASSWQKAGEILLDRLQNSLFSIDDIEKEKKIISEEISYLERNPEKSVFNRFLSIAEQTSLYGNSILGTKESILSISRKNIVDFVNKYYLTSNTVFALVGNLPSIQQIEEFYNSKVHVFSKK